MTIAPMSSGNAKNTSATRINAVYAAAVPSGQRAERHADDRREQDGREPDDDSNARARTDSWSRRSGSVPSQCSLEGGARVLARSWSYGSYGANHGAKAAVTNSSPMMHHSEQRKLVLREASPYLAPRASRRGDLDRSTGRRCRLAGDLSGDVADTGRSLQSDPRVEGGVGKVDEQVQQDEHQDAVRHHANDDWVVLLLDRHHEGEPDPVPVEDRPVMMAPPRKPPKEIPR